MKTNYLDSLLDLIEDEGLRNELISEVEKLRDNKEFGLVYETHIPEFVRLSNYPIGLGSKVQIKSEKGDRIHTVLRIEGSESVIVDSDGEEQTVNNGDLVVITMHGDAIFPGLCEVSRIEGGGDKPYHAVINSENYHALQLLMYTHEGKVDCIYIDPPYNSGKKDWKYNNDYVDSEDRYRHSKWLSFMEKRLLLAKRLLNPIDSVLIVTVDEKEYLRLGMLLEHIFPSQRIQMISSMINPKGSARGKEFYRVDEYIFFVYFGAAVVQDHLVQGLCITRSNSDGAEDDENNSEESEMPPPVRWASLLRSGGGAQREESELKFYPILVDEETEEIVDADDPLPLGQQRDSYNPPDGLTAIWPIRKDGSEGRWSLNQNSFRTLLADKHIKIGTIKGNSTYEPMKVSELKELLKGSGKLVSGRKSELISRLTKVTFYYLMKGQRKKLAEGELVVVGEDEYGGIILEYSSLDSVSGRPKTQWTSKTHSATDHGSSLLRKIIPGRKFPYPKSLYAVEDTIRFFVKNKPDAVIVDFFAGSGTTTHAVARLNRQDGGSRQSIMITNNEVGAADEKSLRLQGFYPGDNEWEERGIFRYLTLPRIQASMTGVTPSGQPIDGEYKYTDVFPMAEGFEENVIFLEMQYLSPDSVSKGESFDRIAPILWMEAGSSCPIIESENDSFVVQQGTSYAILFDVIHWKDFIKELDGRDEISSVFIVTDSPSQFQQVVNNLPSHVEATMLYEDYLRSFQIGG